MKKTGLLFLTLGALSFVVGSTNYDKTPKRELDTKFIVTLNTPTDSKEAVELSQKRFLKDLKHTIGYDFEVESTFKNITNGFTLRINKEDLKLVESIRNVEKVTEDQVYFFSETSNSTADGLVINETVSVNKSAGKETDPTKNYSLDTMNVPKENKGGEGTIVAVLDSGFLLTHNAFKPMDSSVKVRYTEEQIKNLMTNKDDPNYKQFYAKFTEGVSEDKMSDVGVGEHDMNTYFNNKIPFQYDYGGQVYFRNFQETTGSEYFYKDEDGEFHQMTQEEYENDHLYPDSNTYSPYSAHGTHVAGTIAGNDRETFVPDGFTTPYIGVAPKAQLALMKVFTDYIPIDGADPSLEKPEVPYTGASDTSIMQALEDALILDVDLINMSLGQDLNDFDHKSASFNAFKKLRENKTLVNVSAGNNGRTLYSLMGPYANHLRDDVEIGTLGSYANSDDVMTIGSGNLQVQHFEKAIMIGKHAVAYDDQLDKEKDSTLSQSILLEYLGEEELPYYLVPGLGDNDDYTDEVIEKVDGAIALVMRGDIAFTKKISLAAEHGAIAVGIINNDPGATDFNMRMDLKALEGTTEIPVVMILNKDLEIIKNHQEEVLKEDPEARPTLHIISNKDVDNPNVGKLSEFSTDGATYDLRIKPEIFAPGSVIKGPVPGKVDYATYRFAVDQKAYDHMSGTSMSSPNYTGSMSVLLSEISIDREERKAEVDKLPMRAMSTAEPKSSVVGNDMVDFNKPEDYEHLYSPRRQGAGMVNVEKAMKTKVYLEGNVEGRSKIELYNNDDVAQGNINLEFKVHNESGKEIRYTPTVYLFSPEIIKYTETPTKNKDNVEEYENEEWLGRELVSVNNHFIKKQQLEEIVVSADELTEVKDLTTVSLTTEEKKLIETNYPNGTYLDGYIVLEPSTVEEGISRLNMPFLGFYGDYLAQEPVEPFQFEKDPNKVYGSDLMQTLNKKMGLETGSFESYVGGTTLFSLNDQNFVDSMQAMWINKKDIKDFTEELYYDEEKQALFAGGPDKTDLLFMQLFVNRSIATSEIRLLNERGENICHDPFGKGEPKFWDPLFGGDVSSLGKSMAAASFLGSVQAHRANAFIPLVDKNTMEPLKDGEYTIELYFTYQASLSTHIAPQEVRFKKSIKLIVDSTPPELIKTEVVKADGIEYLRVYFKEDYLSAVGFAGGILGDGKFTKLEDGLFYADIKVEDVLKRDEQGKLHINAIDRSLSNTNFLLNLGKDAKGRIIISGKEIVPGSILKSTFEDTFTKDKDGSKLLNRTYHVDLSRRLGNKEEATPISNKNKVTVYIDVSDFEFNDPSELKVYRLDSGYRLPYEKIEYIKESKQLKLVVRDPDFVVVGKQKQGGINNNLGIILGASIGGTVGVAGIGVGTFFLIKVLKKKKLAKGE